MIDIVLSSKNSNTALSLAHVGSTLSKKLPSSLPPSSSLRIPHSAFAHEYGHAVPIQDIMSDSPIKYTEEQDYLEAPALDLSFDLQTVTNRDGYPPIRHCAQTWRAQRDIAFPPCPDADGQDLDVARRLVKGGKIYFAATGGGQGSPTKPPTRPPKTR